MNEQDVIAAFLAGLKAEHPPLRSDGARLYVSRDSIAEWHLRELVIESKRQGDASERCKNLLTYSILSRMRRNQEVRRLLRHGCRDLLHAAMRGRRTDALTPAGESMLSRPEPISVCGTGALACDFVGKPFCTAEGGCATPSVAEA